MSCGPSVRAWVGRADMPVAGLRGEWDCCRLRAPTTDPKPSSPLRRADACKGEQKCLDQGILRHGCVAVRTGYGAVSGPAPRRQVQRTAEFLAHSR